MKKALFMLLFALCGCAQIPKGVTAVKGFDVHRYLGTWYEIARLDHSFERGLTHVKGIYTLKEDGSLHVVNEGFDPELNVWKEAVGRGHFVSGFDQGQFKVSFFGPFYGGYNIIELDHQNYSYALVCGNTRSYLWILARDTKLPTTIIDFLIQRAKNLGFETDQLLFSQQGDEHEKQFSKKEHRFFLSIR